MKIRRGLVVLSATLTVGLAAFGLTACGSGNEGGSGNAEPQASFVTRYSEDDTEILCFAGFESAKNVTGDYVIPSEYNGEKVLGVISHAFEGANITSVTFPENLSYIEIEAFSQCENLTTVYWNAAELRLFFPAGNMGPIFQDCPALTDVIFGETCTYIPEDALFGCSSIQNVSFSEGVEVIENGAFAGCASLKSISFPESLTFIGNDAFWGCSSITELTIPESVEVGDGAFYGCSGLTSLAVPSVESNDNGYGSVFKKYFYGIDGIPVSLKTITVLGGSAVADGAFSECPSETIILPDSVTSIGDYAFARCGRLTSVTIPDSVTSIGDSAFLYCESLTSITIGNGVANIGDFAFSECSRLTSVTIPDSVTSIGENALYGCSALESITLPFIGARAGVTATDTYQYPFGYIFGTYSYEGGKSVQQKFYGESTSSTTYEIYYIPTSLKSVTITGGEILYGAFDNCEYLTSVVLLDGLTSIGDYAFAWCSSLTSVTIPDGVTSIGGGAFSGCSGLTSVTIPDGVTSIGGGAFSGCSGLTSVTIPDGVTSIGDYAFAWCSSLTSVTIPDGVTSIGEGAFSGCSGLTSVTIPNGVTSIGGIAFSGCSELTSITIPDGVTSIEGGAFSGCSGLTSVTIPDGVTFIGKEAFSGCSGLTSITIPDGVTFIGNEAFYACTSIKSVYYGGTLEDWFKIEYHSNPLINNVAFYLWDGEQYNALTEATVTTTEQLEKLHGASSIKQFTVLYNSDYSGTVYLGFTSFYSLEKVNLEYFEDEISLDVSSDVQVVYGYNCSQGVYGDLEYVKRGGMARLTAYNGTAQRIILPEKIDGVPVTGLDAIFKGNEGVKQVIIPEGYTTIADETFYNCTALELVYLPSTLTSMGKNVFYNNNMPIYLGNVGVAGEVKLAPDSIYYALSQTPSDWPKWSDKGYIVNYNCKFDCASSMIYKEEGDNVTLRRYCGLSESVTTPESLDNKKVTKIGDGTFYNRSDVTQINISSGVEELGNVSFSGTGIESITLPEGVKLIQPFAFNSCVNLTTVNLPQSLGQIGQQAFEYCSKLTSLVIPANVYSIAYCAFRGCTALASVTFEFGTCWQAIEMTQSGSNVVPSGIIETPDLSNAETNASLLTGKYLFWVLLNSAKTPS